MPIGQSPAPSDKIISFAGQPGRASTLNYDVSMPSRFRGRRVMELDLELSATDFKPSAATLPPQISALRWEKQGGSDVWTYNSTAALDLWVDKATATYTGAGPIVDVVVPGFLGVPAPRPFYLLEALPSFIGLARQKLIADAPLHEIDPAEVAAAFPMPFTGTTGTWDVKLSSDYNTFVRGLGLGQMNLPGRNWDGSLSSTTSTVKAEDVLSTDTSDIRLLLVESYGISSYLGDYGLGHTVRTFTLLPGEETTITMKTWQTDTTKSGSSTSIVDSYDEKSSKRFNESVQKETTDKATRSEKLGWHAEAEVGASFGFGSAKASGGAAGDTQTSREQFGKDVTNAVKEHCAEASSNRSNTVALTAETETVAGVENTTTRTIRNINLRRVLNFVFRELNQEYETIVHLLDVRIAAVTSTPNSYRDTPISGLRPFLSDIVIDAKIDEVAQKILQSVGTVTNETGSPIRTLEKLKVGTDGSYEVSGAAPGLDGTWAPPAADGSFLYRWKTGPLGQEDSTNKVEGVALNRTAIVMRTPDLVVEALLGQADALDEFAMYSQFEETELKRLETRKTELALDTLEGITDPKARADAWASFFPPPTKIISSN